MSAMLGGTQKISASMEGSLHRDDLHILELSNIPLSTPGLQKAKMVKNSQLDTMVELFGGSETGSGQVAIRDLYSVFLSNEEELNKDLPTLNAIAELSSFDVYSLRVGVRDLGIQVNDIKILSLSEEKKLELATKMAIFTRPLIMQVYGGGTLRISDMNDILNLFKNPNTDEALTNLAKMSDKLNIQVHELPDFLEEYGDIFLSLSYFEHELEIIIPSITNFIQKLDIVNESSQMRADPSIQNMLKKVKTTLTNIMRSLRQRLSLFRRKFEEIWGTIEQNSFEDIKRMIQSNHNSLGGVLCGLAVKMKAWDHKFGDTENISPSKLTEFVRTEILTGMDKLLKIEKKAAVSP